ncbi:hypothetical protein K0M31_002465, partial [Melipona bicolor]
NKISRRKVERRLRTRANEEEPGRGGGEGETEEEARRPDVAPAGLCLTSHS